MESLMKYINVIGRCAAQYRSEQLEQYGLNSRQHPYILHICRNPGISQEKLARAIYVNKSSVTRQITILEEKGLIVRKQDQTDRRVWRVYPTQRMLELLPHVRQVMKEWNEYLLEEFDEEQREHLIAALEQLARRAQDAAKENLKGRERQP